MNKKIKITLGATLSIFAFSTFQPANKYSIMLTKAYAVASTYQLADRGELKSLDVQSTEGKSLDLCDDYDGCKQNLTDEKNYYVTLDPKSDGVKIMAESAGDDYVVKVFESDRKNATPHDVGENISIKKRMSTLYVRTFTSEEALKRAEKNEKITNSDKVYKININKASANGIDDVYIEQLTLDSGIPINFNKDVLTYNIPVDEDQYELTVKVKPKNEDDDTVKIDGLKTTGDDDYKRSLALKKGKNEIKINITDEEDNTRTYTLNVYRGISPSSSVNTTSSSANTTSFGMATINNQSTINSQVAKVDQWVQVNNKWQYNDSLGVSLKNIWYYDKNLGKNYYLQADGTMATEWLSNNQKWYYLGTDGAMKVGWQLVNGTWYYLDSQGVMVSNTTIDGFKLGNDGSLIR